MPSETIGTDALSADDVVAVLGLHKKIGALAVYGSKVDGHSFIRDAFESGPIHDGLMSYAQAWYSLKTEKRLVKVRSYKRDWRSAAMDRIVLRKNAPEPKLNMNDEAIFTGIETCPWAERIIQIETPRAMDHDFWGDETPETISPRRAHSVPYRAIVKAVWNMHVTKIYRCDILAVIEDEVRAYSIEHDQMFAQAIEDGLATFWKDNIEKKAPPPADYRPSCYDYLAEVFRAPKEGYVLDPTDETIALSQQLRAARSIIKTHQLQAEEFINRLCQSMGEADGIDQICTWKKDAQGVRHFRLLGSDN